MNVSKKLGEAQRTVIRGTLLFLAVVLPGHATGAQPDSTDYIEEILVTAQKRVENIQNVPIAISAFSERELERLRVVDLAGVSARTPGFTLGSKDAASVQISMRGIGSVDDGAGADNSVIVYVDEVPINRAAGMDMDLFDLERVEVLRGPQGTLFGRNAVGGAINLVTSRPDEDLRVKLESTVGTFDHLDFRGLVSGQIAENVFGKISFSRRNRDGFLDSTIDKLPNFSEVFPNLSLVNARDINAYDVDRTSVRAGLRFTPGDALEFNLTLANSNVDQIGAQRILIGDTQQYGGFAGDALFPGLRDDYSKEFFEDPGFDRIDVESATLRVDYNWGEGYQFTSISSYRDIQTDSNDVTSTVGQATAILQTGAGLTPAGGVRTIIIAPVSIPFVEESETFTQELRVTSPADDRLRWVAGMFFMKEDVYRDERVILGLVEIDPETNAVSERAPPGESGDAQDVTVDTVAVFGQLDFDISPQLTATIGLRYTEDKKEISRVGTADGIVTSLPFAVEDDATFDEITGRAVLSWTPTDDVLVFGSYSRGFKSGGFQGRATRIESVSQPFGPEIADSYELGLKATFLDGRFQVNPTVFTTDFEDLQVVELLRPVGSPPGTTATLITQNAANAEIDGAEIEYSWYPVDGLTIRGAYTWLDAEFVEFFSPPGFETPSATAAGDRSGNKLLKSPEYSISQLIRYEWHVPAWKGSLALQGEYIHKEEQYSSPDNDLDARLPAYDVANFSLTYMREGENDLEVTFWVDNAFDENYLLHAFLQGGGARGTPAPPRMSGVTVRWSY